MIIAPFLPTKGPRRFRLERASDLGAPKPTPDYDSPSLSGMSPRSAPLKTCLWALAASARAHVEVQGYAPSKSEEMVALVDTIGPDYFHAMGTAVRAGREFTPADTGRLSRPGGFRAGLGAP